MTRLTTRQIADHLIDARQSHRQWDPNDTEPPVSVDDVYAVHEQVTVGLGLEIGAWKVNLLEGQDQSFIAPIYAPDLFNNGAAIDASKFFIIGIEGEIAFRFARDLPADRAPYSAEDVRAAVSEMFPAIEVVDTRMTDGLTRDPLLKMADNQSNGALVTGDPVPIGDWSDATQVTGYLTGNGEELFSGKSLSPITNVFDLMAGGANIRAATSRPILAGDVMTTGSCTGIALVEPGTHVVLEFPDIGKVEVTF